MKRTLRDGFLDSLAQHPGRTALEVEGKAWTYAELAAYARRIARTLDREAPTQPGEPRLTAVLGHRHAETFAAILGALFRGDGYVPLNPLFPPDRTRAMLERSLVRAVVVDASGLAVLANVLDGLDRELVLVVPHVDDASELRARFPRHRFVDRAGLADDAPLPATEALPEGIAYLLFTSGSTGVPKGVMVSHANARAFLEVMAERYAITSEDRFSHTFDLTFDLSVFDLFLAWERGACVCCPTQQQKAFPGKYVTGSRLTVWFSVPSTAVLMSKLRMLKEGSYPGVRWALFCGEALPADVIESFARACPNAIAENLYGPTELTIACTLYRWDPKTSREDSIHGVVPIGEPYPGMEVLVADDAYRAVKEGAEGELLMTGPQLSLGYYRDEERTRAAFVVPPGETRTFYRTGDLVRRLRPGGPLVYLGRIDHQIKIQGYRVELGEVEVLLREASGSESAVAIGWPKSASGADGIVAFVLGEGDAETVRGAVCARLPPYMQPQRVIFVSSFPLNANGKIDRNALAATLSSPTSA